MPTDTPHIDDCQGTKKVTWGSRILHFRWHPSKDSFYAQWYDVSQTWKIPSVKYLPVWLKYEKGFGFVYLNTDYFLSQPQKPTPPPNILLEE
jgi:hypothetical protein